MHSGGMEVASSFYSVHRWSRAAASSSIFALRESVQFGTASPYDVLGCHELRGSARHLGSFSMKACQAFWKTGVGPGRHW